jgi:hypothetical protein
MAYGIEQEKQLLQQSVNNQLAIDGYGVARVDDGGNPAYYGFQGKGGKWYIMKYDSGTLAYTYTTDTLAKMTIPYFLVAWTGRAALTYGEFGVTKFY